MNFHLYVGETDLTSTIGELRGQVLEGLNRMQNVHEAVRSLEERIALLQGDLADLRTLIGSLRPDESPAT